MAALEEVTDAMADAADDCLRVAKACYYFDLQDIDPTKIIPFSEIPLRYRLRYLDMADHIIAALQYQE